MKYMDWGLYHRLESAENGQLQGPYVLQLLMDVSCPAQCKFCTRKWLLKELPTNDRNFLRYVTRITLNIPEEYEERVFALMDSGKAAIEKRIEASERLRKARSRIDDIVKDVGTLCYQQFYQFHKEMEKHTGEDLVTIAAYTGEIVKERTIGWFTTMMPLEYWLKLIREAAEIGVRRVEISSLVGEPLAEKDIIYPVLKEIKKQGMAGSINTNAYFADDDFIDLLLDIKWDYLTVSLQGATKETHDRLMSLPGSYERIIHILERLSEGKKKRNMETPGLQINFTITRENYTEVPDVFEIARKYGITHIRFNPLKIITVDSKEELKMPPEEEERFLEMVKRMKKEGEADDIDSTLYEFLLFDSSYILTYLDLVNHPEWKEAVVRDIHRFVEEVDTYEKKYEDFEKVRCGRPFFEITVSSDGTVFPSCAFMPIFFFNMNIQRHHLKDIWYSKYYDYLRKRMQNGDPMSVCHRCPFCIHKYWMMDEYKRVRRIRSYSSNIPRLIKKPLKHSEAALQKTLGKRDVIEKILNIMGYTLYEEDEL